MMMKPLIAGLLAIATYAVAPPLAHASGPSYPERPIRLVVPFPPGGLADLVARPLAQQLSTALGQPVIIENRGGASGTVGTAHVAASVPDGYTLLFATANEIAVCPLLYRNLPYDTFKSFSPIASVVNFPAVLVTSPSKPYDLASITASARRSPGKLTFASSGAGSTNHLIAEVFRRAENLDVVHVHYKGGGPAMADVAGGHVDAMFATLPSALPLIEGGTLKALATSGARRSNALPAVPTLTEAGVKDGDVTVWAAVLGPAGLPATIVERLDREVARIVGSPDFVRFLESKGAEPHYAPPAGLQKQIAEHNAFWSRTIDDAGIRLE